MIPTNIEAVRVRVDAFRQGKVVNIVAESAEGVYFPAFSSFGAFFTDEAFVVDTVFRMFRIWH
jgi:hypothetical protein